MITGTKPEILWQQESMNTLYTMTIWKYSDGAVVKSIYDNVLKKEVSRKTIPGAAEYLALIEKQPIEEIPGFQEYNDEFGSLPKF